MTVQEPTIKLLDVLVLIYLRLELVSQTRHHHAMCNILLLSLNVGGTIKNWSDSLGSIDSLGGPSYHTHQFSVNLDAVLCCVAVCYHKVYGCLAVGPLVCDCTRRIPPSESARFAFSGIEQGKLRCLSIEILKCATLADTRL